MIEGLPHNPFESLSPDTHEDDHTDDDDEHLHDAGPSKRGGKKGGGGGGGKGKGKGDGSGTTTPHEAGGAGGENGMASARKMQNRVAQREFRQRKLQYVKDLEARVEFLSSSKDDQLEALKAMLRGLLEENKQLRSLLQNVTAFIGKGIGGKSHELGFANETDFEEFVNRADRDTLHTIHEGWKTQYAKNNKVDVGEKFYVPKGKVSNAVSVAADKDKEFAKAKEAKHGGSSGGTTGSAKKENSQQHGAGSAAGTPGGDSASSKQHSHGDHSKSSPASTNGSPAPATATAAGPEGAASNGKKRTRDSKEPEPSTQRAKHANTNSASRSNSTGANIANNSNSSPAMATSTSRNATGSSTGTVMNSNVPGSATTATPPSATMPPSTTDLLDSFRIPNISTSSGNPYGNAYHYATGGLHGSTINAGPNSFFFDIASPVAPSLGNSHSGSNANTGTGNPSGGATGSSSTPSSSSRFTTDFLSEFAHTGLTPMGEPGSNAFSWLESIASPTALTGSGGGSSNGAQNSMSPTSFFAAALQNSYPLPSRGPLGGGSGSFPHFHPQQQQQMQQQQQQQQQQQPQQHQQTLPSPPASTAKSSPGATETMTVNPVMQAIQLISYHMRSKQANPGYILPMALAPTQMQILTPHDQRIDTIIWPSMRDRLITHPELELPTVLSDLLENVSVHPTADLQDLLDSNYWELREAFVRKYRMLVGPEVLETTNSWRRSRGERDISPA